MDKKLILCYKNDWTLTDQMWQEGKSRSSDKYSILITGSKHWKVELNSQITEKI